MFSRLKTFLRQELDVLLVVRLQDILSFHLNLFRLKKVIKIRLNLNSERKNTNTTAQEKYLNYKFWIKQSLIRVYQLNLQSTESSKNILDIGTGAGYFPFLCSQFGHNGLCLDVPDNQLYDQITDSLGLTKYKKYIRSFEPLDIEVDEKFDLITAYMICFNNHKQENLWQKEEWEFFLDDLKTNYLREDGDIILNFNEESPDIYFTEELVNYFTSMNYKMYRNTILIRSPSIR